MTPFSTLGDALPARMLSSSSLQVVDRFLHPFGRLVENSIGIHSSIVFYFRSSALDGLRQLVEFGGRVAYRDAHDPPPAVDQEVARDVVVGEESVRPLFGVESDGEAVAPVGQKGGYRRAVLAARDGQERELPRPRSGRSGRAARVAASARQGGHHVAQKFSSSTLPSYVAGVTRLPSSSSTVKSGNRIAHRDERAVAVRSRGRTRAAAR